MINPQEHVYDDDPGRGHADVRTRLAGVSYFFLGNGLIQGAVQWAPGGEGTPLGLLVMDPDRLRKKRDALTQDARSGLQETMIQVWTSAGRWTPAAGGVRARWDEAGGVPAVVAEWDCPLGRIEERFYCPDTSSRTIAREVRHLQARSRGRIHVATGVRGRVVSAVLEPAADASVSFLYQLDPARESVDLRVEAREAGHDARHRWASRARYEFGHPAIDWVMRASQCQLEAALSSRGRMDASIWQYNREWVRDQALVAIGFLMSGDAVRASCILRRLLAEFITPEGGAMDSSEARAADEAELDQNGILLQAVEQYVRWTGDATLVADAWPGIAAAANYPLRPEFGDPASGLLANRREFWERHHLHGIKPGFELAHQVCVSMGLRSAASLARRAGREADAVRWTAASERLKAAALSHPTHALVHEGRLIKRKSRDGTIQDLVEPLPGSLMPAGVPLMGAGPHRLNPDTSVALPIVMRFIDPSSAMARATLESLEPLWNQGWDGGGYGRYDMSSEPDSPGAWPFASIFVARAAVEAGLGATAWRVLEWLDRVAGSAAGSWFEFYGHRQSPPFPQVGIVPWTWSEVVALGAEQVLGIRHETGGLRVRPHLLPGLDHAAARVPMCGGELCLRVSREPRPRPTTRLIIDGHPVRETRDREAVVARAALRGAAADVEIILPAD